MNHWVEGDPVNGFRVLTDAGPLTGRKKTEADALAAASIKPEPVKKSTAKK